MLWNGLELPSAYYQDDAVYIIHGDCREILPLIPDKSIDLVLTDPPYNMKHVDGGGFASARAFYRDGKLEGMTDFMVHKYAEYLEDISDQIVAFHSRDSIMDWGLFCLSKFGNYDLHFWYKPNAIPFVNNTWKSDVEYISLGWRAKKHQKVTQDMKSKVFINPIVTEDLHPAQKPAGVIDKYINVLTMTASLILDPFLGSGTTAYCAKKLNRKCIGIEINEKYCEIAAKRCSQTVMNLGI